MIDPVSERRAALVLGDFFITLAAFYVGGWLRFGPRFDEVWQILGLPSLGRFGPVLALVATVTFYLSGCYLPEVRWSLTAELQDLFRSVAVLLGAVLSLLYLFRLVAVSRLLLAGFFTLLFLGCSALRVIVRIRIRRRMRKGLGRRQVLFVGAQPVASDLARSFERHSHLGIRAIGFIGSVDEAIGELPRLGGIDDLPMILSTSVVDEVMVCLKADEWSRLDDITGVCRQQGKAVRVPVRDMYVTLSEAHFDDLDGITMLSLAPTHETRAGMVGKRVFDLVGAITLLAVLSPLLLVVSIWLLLSQGSPILYRQARGGLHGRPFRALKFRTMEIGAEAKRIDLLDRNERTGPIFKLTDDPRITHAGRTLRRASVDELPQLINVLKGEMSLVGPRPQPVEEVMTYDLWHRRRLSMKPGITGLWQVTARNDPGFDRWMELDLEYIDRWSPWLDLQILARTPVALIRSPGT